MEDFSIYRKGSNSYNDRYRWIEFNKTNGILKIYADLDLTKNEPIEIELTEKEKSELIKFLHEDS